MIPTDVLVQACPELGQLTPPPCPYRGLFAFREDDADFFFGRDEFIQDLLAEVQRRPVVAVVGPSGSGKSSVVFAGLLPRLRREGGWLVVETRPGTNPSQRLAIDLLPHLEPIGEADRVIVQEIFRRGADITLGLRRVLQKNPGTNRLLIVVDQFEELFSHNRDEVEPYLDKLLYIPDARLGGDGIAEIKLVITLRADFLGYALSYRPLADAMQDSTRMLGPMPQGELEQAITRPAAAQGVIIEDGLTERILGDVGREPGNLPLMEFALDLLWERQLQRKLTHAAYDEIGGVSEALSRYAEGKYQQLSDDDRDRARRIFTQLVHPGQGTEDTRRLARRSQVGESNWNLVARLASERLVVTGRGGPGETAQVEETAEVIHEALIREWGTLKNWMREDRDFRIWQERLRVALRQWEEAGRSNRALLVGVALGEARKWLIGRGEELADEERLFTRLSMVRERRNRWLVKIGVAALGVLTLVAAVAGGLALTAAKDAGRQRDIAQAAAQEADNQRLNAEAASREADNQRREAVFQKQEAERQAKVAEEQQQIAESQRRAALSRQLATQALSLSSQGFLDHALLLTQEALRFSETTEALSALLAALQYSPNLMTFLETKSQVVSSTADGKLLAWLDNDGGLTLLDVKNLEQVDEFTLNTEVDGFTFSPDGSLLAWRRSIDGTVIWNLNSGERLGKLTVAQEGTWVRDVAINPSGEIAVILLAGLDPSIVFLGLR
jgi:hypothetical protein